VTTSPPEVPRISRRRLLALGSTLLPGVLAGCSATSVRELEHGTRLATPTAGDAAVPTAACGPPPLRALSLREAEAAVRRTQASATPGVPPLLLGGFTDLHGYRWDAAKSDVLLIGSVGEGPRLLVDQFASALRVGHHDFVGMTLVPVRPDPHSDHRVITFPREIEDTLFAAPLVAADHDAKRRAAVDVVDRYRRDPLRCGGSPSAGAGLPALVVFTPGPPALEFSRDSGGHTVWIRRVDIRLLPGLTIAGAAKAPLPEDSALAAFAADFTARFDQLRRGDPVLKQLHNMYVLFLLAQLLRAELRQAELRSYDPGFWLSEYPVRRVALPRLLPGISPYTETRTCWGRPYAPTEYSAMTVRRIVWGGVLIAYRQYLVGTDGVQPAAPLRGDLAPVGASVTTEIWRATVSMPSPSLPEIRLPEAARQALMAPFRADYPILSPGIPGPNLPTIPQTPAGPRCAPRYDPMSGTFRAC
jgi:hypothetical protein